MAGSFERVDQLAADLRTASENMLELQRIRSNLLFFYGKGRPEAHLCDLGDGSDFTTREMVERVLNALHEAIGRAKRSESAIIHRKADGT